MVSENVKELTFKSIILSVLVTLVLCAANAYLGLKVGITVSASIPAAIIALGVLRCFRNHNVYEINMVQTAASTGETLAAGMIFTLPAMLLIHYWQAFNYLESFFIAVTGGFLGILFAVPLRRVLLKDPLLHFPEGTAIGNVLKITQDKNHSLEHLVVGGMSGAVIAFLQGGLKILGEGWQYWTKTKTAIVGVGLGFSPALIGAGFIIGPRVAFSILSGVVVGWLFLIPIFSSTLGLVDLPVPAYKLSLDVWKNQVRYVGLGVLLVAGIWTLISMIKPIYDGIIASLRSIAYVRQHGYEQLPKEEQDIPIHWVFIGVLALAIPLIFILMAGAKLSDWPLSQIQIWGLVVITTVYILFAGFVFASICGYLVGLVGSSSSPVSAMGLAAILFFCLGLFVLALLYAMDIKANTLSLSALAIIVVAIITCICSIANDTMQDLKAGHMIGATPWKQQCVMFIGVLTAAAVLPWVMEVLYNAYGIGDMLPRADMNPSESLAAPQAQLMAAIAKGVFEQSIPWFYIQVGVFIAGVSIIINQYLKQFGFALPTLGIGMGIYLPIESSTSIIIGGAIALLAQRALHGKDSVRRATGERQGIMVASGLVAGAALVGILLAIPFMIFESTDALRIMPKDWALIAKGLSLLVTIGLGVYLYRVSTAKPAKA